MSKYVFRCEHSNHITKEWQATVELTVDAETLSTILGSFEDFLLGCGFKFDGHLEIVEEEDD